METKPDDKCFWYGVCLQLINNLFSLLRVRMHYGAWCVFGPYVFVCIISLMYGTLSLSFSQTWSSEWVAWLEILHHRADQKLFCVGGCIERRLWEWDTDFGGENLVCGKKKYTSGPFMRVCSMFRVISVRRRVVFTFPVRALSFVDFVSKADIFSFRVA